MKVVGITPCAVAQPMGTSSRTFGSFSNSLKIPVWRLPLLVAAKWIMLISNVKRIWNWVELITRVTRIMFSHNVFYELLLSFFRTDLHGWWSVVRAGRWFWPVSEYESHRNNHGDKKKA